MLAELLKETDPKVIEFRENTKYIASLLTTIGAFANTCGGHIVIGIDPISKEIKGLINPHNEKENLQAVILDAFSPFFCPDFFITSFKEKAVLIIKVPHLIGVISVFTKDEHAGVYIRLGSSNIKASKEQLAELNRLNDVKTWDEHSVSATVQEALDEKALLSAFQKAKLSFSDKLALSLGLYSEHGKKLFPTKGSLILFGKDRGKKGANFKVSCTHYAGVNKRSKILEHLELKDSIPGMIEKMVAFARKHSKEQLEMDLALEKEINPYPPKILKEVMVNAFMHADYSAKAAEIELHLFQDRVEVKNPGLLHFGLKMQEALSGISACRNKIIAKVFYELKIAKGIGEGLKSIVNAAAKLGLSSPSFKEEDNSFITTLFF